MVLTKDYYAARELAISWLNGTREYSQGIDILRKSGYKPYLTRTLSVRGDTPASRDILLYEIRQMLQYWYDPQAPQHEDVVPDGVDEPVVNDNSSDTPLQPDVNYPPVIAAVIHKFSELYKTRSQLHGDLMKLPESNTDEVIAQRKKIVNSIEGLSARMDTLFKIRDNFEKNGVIPDSSVLDSLFADPDSPAVNSGDDDSYDEEEQDDAESQSLTIDIDSSSIEHLKKMRGSEASKLTRAKNELLYQSRTIPPDRKENPMPDCPRRIRLTKKVDRITALILQIDTRIAELC